VDQFSRLKARVVAGTLLAWAAVATLAQPMPGAVTEAQARSEIRQALAAYGQAGFGSFRLPSADQLRVPWWPPAISAKTLGVAQVQMDPVQQAWRIQLRCLPPQRCLPFVVYVPGTAPQGALWAASRARSFGQMRQAPAPLGVETVVRAGQTVRLVTDEPGMRLIQPALCLDRGAVGERVRVRPRSRRRWACAVVLGPGLVRAIQD